MFKQIKWHFFAGLPEKKYDDRFIVAVDIWGVPHILLKNKSSDWLDVKTCFKFPVSYLRCWAFLTIPEEKEKKEENKSQEEKK